MANQTLDTAGSGGHTTFASALAAITLPSDIIYVKSTSVEAVTTSVVYNNTIGTPSEPTKVVSVNNFTSYTPTFGGGWAASGNALVSLNGNFIFDGIVHGYTGTSFTSGFQIGTASGSMVFTSNNCDLGSSCSIASSGNKGLRLGPIASSSGNDSYFTNQNNLKATFGHTLASIGLGVGEHIIKNLSISGVTPTVLFRPSPNTGVSVLFLSNSNLSTWAIDQILGGDSAAQSIVRLNNVKLHASTVMTSGIVSPFNRITAINCSSGDTSIAFADYMYAGSVLSDSTVKASSSPLTDGVTEFSRKFTPTSTCGRGTPLTTELILAVADNESIQPWVNVLIGADGASALTNAELWIDVSACTVDGTTTGTVTSTRAAILATPTAHANSNTAYNDSYTTPMTHTVQIPSAITVRQTGYVKITVNLAYTTNPVYLGKYGR